MFTEMSQGLQALGQIGRREVGGEVFGLIVSKARSRNRLQHSVHASVACRR